VKVYAVSRGSYSDYSIVAIFTDEEIAAKHQHEIDPGNEVEAFELVETEPRRIVVYHISNNTYHGRGVEHEWSHTDWDYNRASYKRADVQEYGASTFRALRASGLDQEAVRQAYRDRKARLQAREAGIA
jgi:hypothetical protein